MIALYPSPSAGIRSTQIMTTALYNPHSDEYDTVHDALTESTKTIDTPCLYLVYIGHMPVFINRKLCVVR